MLPAPNQEDLFIENLQTDLESGQKSQEDLRNFITMAIESRRPKLAGRLFQLLDVHDTEDPNLQKAQNALAFLLIEDLQEVDHYWEEVQTSWAVFQPSKAGQRLRERHHPQSSWLNSQLPPRSSKSSWRRR